MVWISLIAVALISGGVFGVLAAIRRTKGRATASLVSAITGLAAAIGLALGYAAYLQTRAGTLPPDHFYHSVTGNAVVVGGMIVSFAVIVGVLAHFLLILRKR